MYKHHVGYLAEIMRFISLSLLAGCDKVFHIFKAVRTVNVTLPVISCKRQELLVALPNFCFC
jgi:hypothetical protein